MSDAVPTAPKNGMTEAIHPIPTPQSETQQRNCTATGAVLNNACVQSTRHTASSAEVCHIPVLAGQQGAVLQVH